MLAYPAIPVIKSKYTTYETGTAITEKVNSDGSITITSQGTEDTSGTSSYDNKVKNIKTHSYDFDQYSFATLTETKPVITEDTIKEIDYTDNTKTKISSSKYDITTLSNVISNEDTNFKKLFNVHQVAETDTDNDITKDENIISDFSYSFVLDADAKIGDKKIGVGATVTKMQFTAKAQLPKIGNLITSGSDTANENSAPKLSFKLKPDFTDSS
jgi:hypothetical protein